MSNTFPLSLLLAWLAGAEPALLAHAYPDRARYASLGLSVAGAALAIGIGLAVAGGLVLGVWAGWMLLPVGLVCAGAGLRRAFRWACEGPRLRRRVAAVSLGLLLLARLLEWPLGRVLLHSAVAMPTTGSTALTALHWALGGVLAQV